MTDIQLIKRINSLPADLKNEVNDFVEFLNQKAKRNIKPTERKFGYYEGFFKMSPDFSASLSDFKEYM